MLGAVRTLRKDTALHSPKEDEDEVSLFYATVTSSEPRPRNPLWDINKVKGHKLASTIEYALYSTPTPIDS